MKKILKYKKQILGGLGLCVSLMMLLSIILLTLTLLKYGPIEPVLRYTAMIIMGILWITFSIFLIRSLIKKKSWPKIVWMIVMVLFSSIFFYGNYVLSRASDTIDRIHKDTTIYSTSLITKKEANLSKIEDLKKIKIAISKNQDSIDGYQIGKEIIDEFHLLDNNEIVTYEDYPSIVKALYNKEVQAAFLPTNSYNSFAENQEKENLYKDILKETTVLLERSKEVKKEEKPVVEFSITKPFTVLLMGVDTISDNIKNSAANGDALMLVTFNPNTLNATILSIPRDTYVPITCLNNRENKITHAGWYGETCMEQTIENFTGIDIEYYVKVDFKAVVDLVDALGGIDVKVPKKIVEQDSHRQWGDKTIVIEQGQQHLNGEQALALARHRKTLVNGDIGRGQNQQLVIKGILNQLKKIRSVDTLLDLLDTLEKHMDTNFTRDQILSFYNIGMAILNATSEGNDPINMQQLYLNGYDRYIYEPSMGFALYNYIYYSGSLNDITKAMRVNLDLEKPEVITSFSYSINEPYTENVIGKNNTYTDKFIEVLPNFVGKTQQDVLSWSNKTGIKVSFETFNSSSSEHNEGDVMKQSYPSNYRLDEIANDRIIFTIVHKITDTIDNPTVDCTLEENKNLPICTVIPEEQPPVTPPENNEQTN